MANDRKPNQEYWRGVEELLGTPEFVEAQKGEFPVGADLKPDELSRRNFFKLVGASAGLAGIAACSQPPREKILPYAQRPPEVTPGVPTEYATSFVLDGYARGILAKSTDGRPTKIEGNPQHPASLGATGVHEQASVLQVYDPHRSTGLARATYPATWTRLVETVSAFKATQGAGLRILMEPTSSPLVIELLEEIRRQYPQSRTTFYSSTSRRNVWTAARAIFGRGAEPIYDFAKANVIVDLDADFTNNGPGAVRYSRDFANKRRADGLGGGNRLYVVEPSPTPTGSVADHRLRSRATDVINVAAAIAQGLGASGAGGDPSKAPQQWIAAVVKDLQRNAGSSIVVAGPRQPAAVHHLAHAINTALGNVGPGKPVAYIDSPIYQAGEATHDLRPLVEEMRAGAVEMLLVLDGNPVYNAPADLEFGAALAKVKESLYMGLYRNETGAKTTWYVPLAHYLETWGDARSFDGTVTLQQPLIAPMKGGHAISELLGAMVGRGHGAHQLVMESWQRKAARPDFSTWFEQSVQLGLIDGTAFTPIAAGGGGGGAPAEQPAQGGGDWEVLTPPGPAVHDGRFTNISWMLEFPDPMTKLTWDNAAFMSPASAKKLGVGSGDMVEVAVGNRRLKLAANVLPGHADNSVTIYQGYGRASEAEELAKGVGWNANVLRASATEEIIPGATVVRKSGHHKLALTQTHWSMEDRPIGLDATLADFKKDPSQTSTRRGPLPSLFKMYDYSKGEQWGMAIDLTVCTGCSSCVIACQSENNIPVVGRQEVITSREMHWIRIDRYFGGTDLNEPTIINQPMLCQHCETAPCEYVCPVNATVHSPDGLNEMVYNRCIGTRFCQNNCPYKVRRFNFFDFVARDSRELAMNPDVTVRERGVMEKCTFCVQRIRRTEIAAKVDNRPIATDEFTTACAQACPTKAIVFGNINDVQSEVAKWRKNDRSYEVLHDQGTRPRIRYLVKITDPNPEIG